MLTITDEVQTFCCPDVIGELVPPFRSQDRKHQQPDWPMQSRVDGLGCKVGPCPGCRLDPIRSQHGPKLLVTSEGSGGV